MFMRRSRVAIAGLAALALLLLFPLCAAAQIPDATSISFSDDTAEVSFEISVYELDVSLSFEDVVGLSPPHLGLSVSVVNPLDTTLLSRLPGSLASIPSAFPVLITVEPPNSGGFSFSGIAELEIHTHDLSFTAGTPLRLFRAPVGGDFEAITAGVGTGSYRARGQVGDFSQFLIVADTRSNDSVVDAKFDRLEDLLDDFDSSITSSVAASLSGDLSAALSDWNADDPEAAIDDLESFQATVVANSGSDIPDVWRSARDLTNMAGELRAAAETLIFSLGLAI